MEKKHQELLEKIKEAVALAKAIENEGGNVQGAIHQLNSAHTLIGLRVSHYAEAASQPKPKPKTMLEELCEKSIEELKAIVTNDINKREGVKPIELKGDETKEQIAQAILVAAGYKTEPPKK